MKRCLQTLVILFLSSCSPSSTPIPKPSTADAATAPPPAASSDVSPPSHDALATVSPPELAPDPPVRIEELVVKGDRSIYPVRGSKEHRHKAVMLAGLCSNPFWYLNTFPAAAARYGDFVGLQGEVDCGGITTRWSSNSAAAERRMEQAFDLAGMGDLRDVTLVGYSQGAERAEWLAARDPHRFTRFILIGGPIMPSPAHFAGARAVVLMAGSMDRQDLMRDGATRLRATGTPATFMVLPGARHGEMGAAAEEVMTKALDWLEENDKS
jgi:pimeloyl-ACP methyl ester carboxylesterase